MKCGILLRNASETPGNIIKGTFYDGSSIHVKVNTKTGEGEIEE
ncbi:MAG: hypothetical protein U5K79_00010 [Cyclobacteriaceae bacterium]|nr:hypothetical protein [Cyclobacteriaceae bacterium]